MLLGWGGVSLSIRPSGNPIVRVSAKTVGAGQAAAPPGFPIDGVYSCAYGAGAGPIPVQMGRVPVQSTRAPLNAGNKIRAADVRRHHLHIDSGMQTMAPGIAG